MTRNPARQPSGSGGRPGLSGPGRQRAKASQKELKQGVQSAGQRSSIDRGPNQPGLECLICGLAVLARPVGRPWHDVADRHNPGTPSPDVTARSRPPLPSGLNRPCRFWKTSLRRTAASSRTVDLYSLDANPWVFMNPLPIRATDRLSNGCRQAAWRRCLRETPSTQRSSSRWL